MADVDDRWHVTVNSRKARSARYGQGKRWVARWRDENGRQRSKSFEKRIDAERWLANVAADLSKGTYVDPGAGKVTVTGYAADWRKTLLHRASTADSVERTFSRHVEPVLGHLPIARVRSSHVQAWVTAKSAQLSPETLRVAYTKLAAMFAAAVRDRVIGVSPCTGIRLPDRMPIDRFILTPEQVHALAAAMPPRYRALVYVGAGLGLRIGEACGVELVHVDFLRRETRIVQQLVTIAARAPYIGPPKSTSAHRALELPDVTGSELARHLERFPVQPVEVDDETDPAKITRRPAHLIFTNEDGKPIHRASFSHIWTPAVKAAGLPRGFGFHGLRHYLATLLIHNGASVKTVQLALGHSTPTVTLNTYAGEWPDATDRTRSIVDAALSCVPDVRRETR